MSTHYMAELFQSSNSKGFISIEKSYFIHGELFIGYQKIPYTSSL